MYNKTEQHKLIRYLKSKPKHGANLTDILLEAASAANNFKNNLSVLKDDYVQAATGIDKLIGANELLISKYKTLIADSLKLESRNKLLNDSFGISSEKSAQLSQQFSIVSKQLGISSDLMKKYGVNIQKMIPTLNQLNIKNTDQYNSLIAVQKVLTTNLKLTAAQAEEYSYYATQNGKTADEALSVNNELTKLIDPSGTMGLFKIATAGIAKAGATIQLQYGKIPGNLEMAVLKAHSLGLELSDLQTIGDKLLNIESSINDEIEYQLVSGRRLIGDEKAKADLQGKSLTNAYRMAVFQGESTKQADILNQILEQEGAQLETNLISRKSMSQLLGIDEMQISRAIQKKKLLEKEGAEILFNVDGKDLINQARDLVAQKKMTEKGFEELLKMQDTRTTDELLEELLQINQQIALTNLLSYQQLSIITKTRDATTKNATEIQLIKYVDTQVTALGKLVLDKAAAETATPTQILDDMRAMPGSSMTENTTADSNSTMHQDALMINDGVVKFNARDKFMRVNDSTMIAGTNVDGNRQLAKSINNANSAITNAQISQLIQAFNAVGKMMKDAIDSQTSALKRDNLFAPGINRGTWD